MRLAMEADIDYAAAFAEALGPPPAW